MTTKPTYDDADLERMIRAGLRHHAEDAPTALGAPLPGESGEYAASSPPGTRGRRWLVPAAAAVAALAVPGALLVTNALRDNSSDVAAPPTTSSVATTASGSDSSTTASATDGRPSGIPADWRAESYGGVQVWVPPTWGWGGAPFEPSWEPGRIFDCVGMRAFTTPGSSAYEQAPEDTPYVGRPVMMSDACVVSPKGHPAVDAVFLGAAGIEPGTQAYPDGVIRESRRIGKVIVSVFSKDAGVREQILASATPVAVDANGCPATAPNLTESDWTDDTAAEQLSICIYQPGGLLWSGQVGAKAAAAYDTAVGPEAPGAQAGMPIDWVGEEEIYLRLAAGDLVRWDRYSPTIGVLTRTAKGRYTTPASVANTAPWAKDNGGVKAYIIGGGTDLDPALAQYFRGILG